MIILSHRGLWKKPNEKNSREAFIKSLELGFGIETDVRDLNGELVISHDMPTAQAMTFDEFINIYSSFKLQPTLALNIKSDGLQNKLMSYLTKYKIENYFVFDMSVPDGLIYLNNEFNTFTRQSEYEMYPSFYERAQGIWLDEFHSHWINQEIIKNHIKHSKNICIVSPELHGRKFTQEWANYKDIELNIGKKKLMICTDQPEIAEKYFNEKN